MYCHLHQTKMLWPGPIATFFCNLLTLAGVCVAMPVAGGRQDCGRPWHKCTQPQWWLRWWQQQQQHPCNTRTTATPAGKHSSGHLGRIARCLHVVMCLQTRLMSLIYPGWCCCHETRHSSPAVSRHAWGLLCCAKVAITWAYTAVKAQHQPYQTEALRMSLVLAARQPSPDRRRVWRPPMPLRGW